MQAYEVEFTPAFLSPLRVTDAIRVQTVPAPHVLVGDPSIPGEGRRIPMTVRLIAALDRAAPRIARAKVYRDPKTAQIVFGVEQGDTKEDTRAIVLLSTTTSPPGDAPVVIPKEVRLLAAGVVGRVRQHLLIWPEGSKITVEDPILEQRYELRRDGDEFTRTVLA